MKKNYILIAKKLVLGVALLGFSQLSQAQATCGPTDPAGHHFDYEISVDAGGTYSLTFIPDNATVGSNTLLLWINDFGAAPENGFSPNVPYPLPGAAGDLVDFRILYNPTTDPGNQQLDITDFELGTCPQGGTLSNEVVFDASTSDISVSNGTAFVSNLSGATTISVFNLTGSLVKSISTSASEVSVNVTDLAQGIYILLIDNGGKTQKVKMLVE